MQRASEEITVTGVRRPKSAIHLDEDLPSPQGAREPEQMRHTEGRGYTGFSFSKRMCMCAYITETLDALDVCSVDMNVKHLHAAAALFTHRQRTSAIKRRRKSFLHSNNLICIHSYSIAVFCF